MKEQLMKELTWFAVLLIAFLGLVTILSQENSGMDIWSYVIVTTAFTVVWFIKSYFFKTFG
ncbi:hypothetical protein SAMN04488587_1256 [Methanococcoides vulcani]|uniref:Uncharacterized protein n=1 Tax=Methanococcoides vulcani TaxID=1353158 RepID=A0A1H9ZTB2_9EURY|nr:hypothetical protein SAMN04488587_1256 [Methanococcoides vulcani]